MSAREEPISVVPRFDIIYEDDDLLVADKAAPLITHPARMAHEASLWTGLKALYCYEWAIGQPFSLINRLDRETSGIVLVAKHKQAAGSLGLAMQNRQIHKQYYALVQGIPAWHFASCQEGIVRMGEVAETAITVRQCCHPTGKACHTDFRCLERYSGGMSLIHCTPHTGRMHQIRVHLSHLGLPIVGDKIYGADENHYLQFIEEGWTPRLAALLRMPRHALHACEIRFPHPRTGEEIHINCPLAADIGDFIALQGGILP